MLRDTSEYLREITRRRRKFCKQDVKDLRVSQNFRLIISTRLRLVGPVARMGRRGKNP